MTELRADVAIVGGGVSGCWIARALVDRGYSAALVTRHGLGGGQTGHSHVYIHGGHLYRKEGETELLGHGSTLVSDLKAASGLWHDWLSSLPDCGRSLDAAPTDGLFGFVTDADAADVDAAVWSPLQLASRPVARPSVFDGSRLTAFREVAARCLDAQKLIGALVKDLAVPIVDCESAELHADVQGVPAVVTRGGAEPKITSRAVILSAGAGNRQLVVDLPGPTPVVRDRSSFMLVVEDPRSSVLAPLSGVFNLSTDDGLFLVSRTDRQSTIWLVSDAGHQTEPGEWLKYVCSEFQEVFPAVWARRNELRWAYYEAPKAEVDLGDTFRREVHSSVVLRLSKHVVACWPTKLTLAPLAAEATVRVVDEMLGYPKVPQPTRPPTNIAIVPERWTQTDPLPWSDFAAPGLD